MAGFNRLTATLSRTNYNAVLDSVEAANRTQLGKGVIKGLTLTAGAGLTVNIAAGRIMGVVSKDLAATTAVAPANVTRYLFIREDGSTQFSATAADLGADWVCLGVVVTGPTSITSVGQTGRLVAPLRIPNVGELAHSGKLGVFGAAPVDKTAVADPLAMTVADNAIGSLAIGASYSQAEVQALRNQCELLQDDVRALRTKVAELIDALQAVGLV